MNAFFGSSTQGVISDWVERMRGGEAVTWKDLEERLVEDGLDEEEVTAVHVMHQALSDAKDPAAVELGFFLDAIAQRESRPESLLSRIKELVGLLKRREAGGHPTIIPPRFPDDEETINDMWRTIEQTTRKLAVHPLNQVQGKPVFGRAFHRNMLYGGIGRITMDLPDAVSDLPKSVVKDLEAMLGRSGSSRKAAVRFSKGLGCPFRDSVPDVLGIAVKLENDSGKVVDILATNQIHGSHAGTTPEYQGFTEVITEFQKRIGEDPELKSLLGSQGGLDNIEASAEVLGEVVARILKGELGPFASGKVGWRLMRDTLLHPVESAILETYVSSSGVFCRDGEAGYHFKLLFAPPAGQKAIEGEFEEGHRIQRELEAQIEKGVVMDIRIQLYTGDGEDPDPTNGGEEWSSPAINVGRLDIQIDQGLTLDQRNAVAGAVDDMAFNPSELGDVAKLVSHNNRGEVYRRSAEMRNAMDNDVAIKIIKDPRVAIESTARG
jgi:hypothetical protein